MKRFLTALGVVAMLLGVTAPASAQETDLDGVLDSLASLWARSDAAAIAALGAGGGVEIEVEGAVLGHLLGRTMVAELRRVFENQETLRVVPGMTSRVVGTDDRAFGELTWHLRPAGASHPERSTVFIGLVREARRWRVSQIRLLP